MNRLFSTLLSITFLSGFTFLISCKDDDEPAKTKTQLLTEKTWKLSKVKALGIESNPDPCDGDDVYTFAASGSYSEDEGATKCDPSEPQTLSGTWQFKTNETIIGIVYSQSGISISLDKTIVELSGATLKVSYSLLGFAIEETYVH